MNKLWFRGYTSIALQVALLRALEGEHWVSLASRRAQFANWLANLQGADNYLPFLLASTYDRFLTRIIYYLLLPDTQEIHKDTQ